jgi:hypothetical protein
LSHFNYKSLKVRTEFGETSQEFHELMKSPDVVDTPLHPIGEMQCEANKEALHVLNAKYVMVSPLRRAMQTAIAMFKDHPNAKQIKFLVVPLIREVFHTVCDVPCDVHELMRTFGKGQEASKGLEFDFSMLVHFGEPNFWSVNILCNPVKKAYFYQKLAQKQLCCPVSYESVLEAMRECI